MIKKALLASVLLLGIAVPPVFAANPGDRVITLGADLDINQKTAILSEFQQTNKDKVIVVTAADEVKYLPGSTLSGKEYSSSLITIKDQGKGIKVTKSSQITQVSTEMYQNAILTAGIQDAEVYVTAPMPVTGTAALTGIFKAFETATGKTLSEDRKKTAGEEIVKTSEIGQNLGDQQKASDFVQRLKEEVQKKNPQTDADYRAIIEQVMKDMGIQLSPEQIQGLIDLLKKVKSLNIDWAGLGNQLQDAGRKIGQFVQDNPAKVNGILDFFKELITSIQSLFSKLFG